MTSISETIADRPEARSQRRLPRQSLLGFVAGLALAGSVAVGVNAMTDHHNASSVVPTKSGSATFSAPYEPPADLRCIDAHGPC